jgi:hypothetical protein
MLMRKSQQQENNKEEDFYAEEEDDMYDTYHTHEDDEPHPKKGGLLGKGVVEKRIAANLAKSSFQKKVSDGVGDEEGTTKDDGQLKPDP